VQVGPGARPAVCDEPTGGQVERAQGTDVSARAAELFGVIGADNGGCPDVGSAGVQPRPGRGWRDA
jgi:hypothetical protein